MSVQENIKKIREAKGITQTSVEKYASLSEMQYYRLEKEAKKIDPNVLFYIAKFLGVDMNIFFNDELTDNVIKDFVK